MGSGAVACEPPGQDRGVAAHVHRSVISAGNHEKRIGQIDAQPGLEHPAMHGPLVAGESASHSAAVQRGAHQLVDQVDGIRFVVNPFGKNCGG